MDPRRVYRTEPPPIPDRTAKARFPVKRIDEYERYATAMSVLSLLEQGLRRVDLEKDWLEAERWLARQPKDKRALERRDQLAKLRAPAPKVADLAPGDLPPAVREALELLKTGTRPVRQDRQAVIVALEADAQVVREAIGVWTVVVDCIRSELVAAQAKKDRKQHDELVLAAFRADQAASAAQDALAEFRRSRIDAGYTPWRSDLLPAPVSREALIRGSETDFDSEISRRRRLLEQWKIL